MDDELNTTILKLKMCDAVCITGNETISQIAKNARVIHFNKIIELLSNKGQQWTFLKNLNKR